jgi:SPP1 family holin
MTESEATMKIKTETIIRTIVLILALANQVLAIYGKEKIPITEDEVYQLVTLIVTVVTSLWAWWKNNSFTLPAIKADEYLEQLRKTQ